MTVAIYLSIDMREFVNSLNTFLICQTNKRKYLSFVYLSMIDMCVYIVFIVMVIRVIGVIQPLSFEKSRLLCWAGYCNTYIQYGFVVVCLYLCILWKSNYLEKRVAITHFCVRPTS